MHIKHSIALVLVTLVALVSCIQQPIQGGPPPPPPQAPSWPQQFTTNWTLFNVLQSSNMPPYEQGIPRPPYDAGRGATFYDWVCLFLCITIITVT